MNNALNELYNEILGKTWNIESIKSKFDAMIKTLRQRESNPTQVEQLMKNRTHIEELTTKISQRLNQLGMTMKSFNDLEKQISDYYEEN